LKGQTNFDAGPLFPDQLFIVRVNTGLMTRGAEAEKLMFGKFPSGLTPAR